MFLALISSFCQHIFAHLHNLPVFSLAWYIHATYLQAKTLHHGCDHLCSADLLDCSNRSWITINLWLWAFGRFLTRQTSQHLLESLTFSGFQVMRRFLIWPWSQNTISNPNLRSFLLHPIHQPSPISLVIWSTIKFRDTTYILLTLVKPLLYFYLIISFAMEPKLQMIHLLFWLYNIYLR